jgi:transcriptional regulator with XRE-family HTH domain|tara:strand:- start:742 stop:984 length:243 start_codon:yes stop_codon:yes gene_type:complete
MPTSDKKTLLIHMGATIRYYRNIQGIQQRHLAKRLNHSPAWLSLVESGKRTMSVMDLYEVSKILKMPMEDVFKPFSQKSK